MIAIEGGLAGLSIALLFWVTHRSLNSAWVKYRDTLNTKTQSQLTEMFVFVDLSLLWPHLFALAGTVGLLLWVWTESVMLSALTGVFFLFMPRVILTRARAARAHRLDRQLPDALRMVASALGAGSSLSCALNAIVKDLNAPLSQELSLILREQRVGIPLHDALNNFRLRLGTESVGQVTTLLQVGAESGGSLSALLDRLAANLSAQQHIALKADMLTSQGRMQAWVIGILPILLLVVLWWMDPFAMQSVLTTEMGKFVLLCIALLEITGIFWLRSILRVVTI
ncbi:MAG: type II secretion system F family protein [Betaproteobacteria bacterium]